MHKEKLKDVAEITMGTSPSGDTYNEDGNGLPLLNGPTEFGQMSPNCTLYTTDSKRECKSGDLIFCVRGSTTGRMNWADQVYSLGRGVCSIRGNSYLETKYVKYALDYSLKSLLKLAGGGTFPNLTKTTIHNFEIPYPDSRFEIASILSAFDDLIENNNRRIEILEEMARRIYREWFVHFRYPGHQNDELVDSGTELGEIPEGWQIKPLDDVIDAMGGGTPRTKVDEYWEGGNITWFTPSDLTSSGQLYMSDSGRKITDEGLDNSSAKMFPPYSVMMTSRATLGVIAFNTVPASVNQGFIVCIPNEKVSAYQIYFWLKEKLPSMINQASGATYKEIRKTDFREMNFPVIEENLHNKFVENVEPIFKEIENLERKNERLKETRDLLLPKLISGKIDVEEKV